MFCPLGTSFIHFVNNQEIPFCDVIPHCCFQATTPPISKVEDWHSHISRVLKFLNVLIYTFPCLLWIVLEISHCNSSPEYCFFMSRRILSVMHASQCYTSKAIHSTHGKVYIRIFRLVSNQYVYKNYSSILPIHGLIG